MSDKNAVVVDPQDPRPGGHDLEVRRQVGAGGMGVVKEAYDGNLRRRLAVKLLRGDRADDPLARARFIGEAQITSQLDHPNIIPVHDLGFQPDGDLFFTMKLVDGDTLTEALARTPLAYRSTRDLFDQLQIFLKVCDAVAFAHSRGVIHRDLKPDNIMVGPFGEVYLMDWGVAKVTGQRTKEGATSSAAADRTKVVTAEGTAVGTLHYMSPEQASGAFNAVDERSDVFSLGAILYQVLTLESPYAEQPYPLLLDAVDSGDIPPPQSRTESPLPPRLCKIAMKALARSPDDRYQSPVELKDDVERFLRSGWQFPMRHFPAGAVIVREGTVGDSAYVIANGSCRAFRDIDGSRRELRTMGKGEVFGETSVFSQQHRTASVEAVDRVTVIEISRTHFEEDLGMGFWMGLFVRALAERFQEKEERVLALEAELAKLRSQS